MSPRTHRHSLSTPEGVEFAFDLAGPVTRCTAWVMDLFCVMALSWAASMLLGLLFLISPDFAQAILVLIYFAISIGYGIALEWLWRGQTIGKRLLRLRVVDAEGMRLEFSQIVIRNLLRFVDNLPGFYLVGGLAMLFSPRAQRLGDIAASTLVIRLPRLEEPDLAQALGGKFNSFDAHPHLNARLRQRVSPREATIALQALLRRDSLDPDARVDLFRSLADHFRALVAYPPDATEGLSDEQYIRNVVDVIYKTRG